MRLRKRVRDVDRLKDEGNSAFKAGRLDEAVAKYTEALEVCLMIVADPEGLLIIMTITADR